MKLFKSLSSRGDTIVEVLIVLAVLGLAFSVSAATANRALKQSRNAEEHSQALGKLDSQVELMRTAIANDVSMPTGVPFCMVSASEWKPATDAACTSGNFSTIITYSGPANDADSTGYYDMRVKWEGIGNIGNQQEVFRYRFHHITQSVSGIGISNTPLQIAVNVPILKQDSVYVAASCSSSSTKTKSITVTLQRNDGVSQTGTTSGNVAVFPDLTGAYSYRAVVAVPAGYSVCDPNPSAYKYVDPVAPPSPITIRLVPQCSPYTATDYSKPPIYQWVDTSYYINHPQYYTPGAFTGAYQSFNGQPNEFVSGGTYWVYWPSAYPAFGISNPAAYEASGWRIYAGFQAIDHPAWQEYISQGYWQFVGYPTSTFYNCTP